jgi:hypothetical protein
LVGEIRDAVERVLTAVGSEEHFDFGTEVPQISDEAAGRKIAQSQFGDREVGLGGIDHPDRPPSVSGCAAIDEVLLAVDNFLHPLSSQWREADQHDSR